MDFVARAGAIIDRAHRMAGVLLICVVVLGAVTTCQWAKNASLNAQLMDARVRLPVIVVPGATSGMYSPTEDERLTYMFTNYITQNLNTFTPETIAKQFNIARGFFAPALLTDSTTYFERKLRDSVSDRRSSLFVEDRDSIKVKKYQENGIDVREVNMVGALNTIIAGTVAEATPLEINMKFEKGLVSPANPYGFTLTYYREAALIKPGSVQMPGTAPQAVAPAPQSGQTGN